MNATPADPCLVENTTYTFPSPNSHSLYSISVIRHNCVAGFYCEPESLTCGRAKAIGQPCSADFECITVSGTLVVNFTTDGLDIVSRRLAIKILA